MGNFLSITGAPTPLTHCHQGNQNTLDLVLFRGLWGAKVLADNYWPQLLFCWLGNLMDVSTHSLRGQKFESLIKIRLPQGEIRERATEKITSVAKETFGSAPTDFQGNRPELVLPETAEHGPTKG